MNDKQKIFADHYLIDLNATQAAIRAGYSVQTARVQASKILKIDDVSNYIKEHRDQATLRTQLDLEWVLNRFKDIADRCMKSEPVMIFVDGKWIESGEYKFDSSGAIKATEMIGKIIGAFEKDNQQSKSVIENPTINIIYVDCPYPIANSEKDVDLGDDFF